MAQEIVSSLEQENKHLKEENQRLYDLIRMLKRDKFGSSSERVEEVSEQYIFNEIEKEAPKTPEGKIKVSYERKKGKSKRKPFPKNIEREEVIIGLPEAEKFCPHDGSALKEIGEVITEKMKSVPAQLTVLIERRKKYACPSCEIHLAEAKSKSILPGSIATPELLSYIIFSKFFQSLPLYRLEEYYKLNGVDLKRGTMARWLVQISEKLIPVWNILEEKAMDSAYLAIDATSVHVLKEDGRRAKSKSFMWVRGSPEKGIVLFDYHPSGGGAVAKNLLTGFSGAVQADAHRGYYALDRKKLHLMGCMMHARRRFHKAWLLGKKQPGIAADALSMFKFIYDKEARYKKQSLTPKERKEWREKEVGPSLIEMKKWFGWQLAKVPPKSPIGNALKYFINEFEELTAFLRDGRYEIDNGWVERQIKRFAVGRKNWLFSATTEGANASSLLYSLVLTAKLNQKDPFKIMVEVLKKIPSAESIEDYEEIAELFLSEDNPNSCRKKEGALIH